MGQVTERYYSFQEAAERAEELARSLKLGSTIRTDESGAFLVSYPRTAQVLLLEEDATLPEDKPAREEKIERGGLVGSRSLGAAERFGAVGMRPMEMLGLVVRVEV